MTSSKPRRCYLSRVVHIGLLSHAHCCHCVSQSLLLRSTHTSSLRLSSQNFHHTTQSPPRCTNPPSNGHSTNHRIAATNENTHIAQPKKQHLLFVTSAATVSIHHEHHHYHNTLFYTSQSRHTNPYLCIMHIAKHTSLVIHPIHIVH